MKCTALILCLSAAIALSGCTAANVHYVSQSPTAGTTMTAEAAAILTRNAVDTSPQRIELGAGDRFGNRLHEHHIAQVRAQARDALAKRLQDSTDP